MVAQYNYESIGFADNGICRFDCCFKDLKSGARASAAFGICTGFINLVIGIWAITRLIQLQHSMEPHNFWIYFCPGIIPIMAIELAAEVGMVILSFGLLVGINRGNDGRIFVKAWIVGMIGFRIFDCLYGIYILAWLGGYRVSDAVFMEPGLIVITIYWILNTIFLIICLVVVNNYWEELMEQLFGKELRKRHFLMLTNIRSAAGRRTTMSGRATPARSGAMTPSQYSSYGPPRSQASGPYGGPSRTISQSSGPGYPQQYHGPPPGKY